MRHVVSVRLSILIVETFFLPLGLLLRLGRLPIELVFFLSVFIKNVDPFTLVRSLSFRLIRPQPAFKINVEFIRLAFEPFRDQMGNARSVALIIKIDHIKGVVAHAAFPPFLDAFHDFIIGLPLDANFDILQIMLLELFSFGHGFT